MKLDASLLDKNGRLRRDDLWMRSRIRQAGALVDKKNNFITRIDPHDYKNEAEADDTYKHFYGTRFPEVFRVEDLYWFTFMGPKPSAVVLVCSSFDDIHARVMFRLDKNGMVCAHAYGIAVTEAMLAFAKQQLPKLERQVKKTESARIQSQKPRQPRKKAKTTKRKAA